MSLFLVVGGATVDASAAPIDEARALAVEGVKRYRASDWSGAMERLVKAESLYHAPTHVLYIARCLEQLGRLVEARKRYASLAEESIDDAAPEVFHEAKQHADRELRQLEERLPKVLLLLDVGSAPPTVKIDGVLLAAQALTAPIPLDPGPREFFVAAPGFEPLRRVVVLEPGSGMTRVALKPPRRIHAGATEPVSQSPREALYWPAGIAFGVAGAGMIVGAATGVLAITRSTEGRSRCLGVVCPAEDEALIAQAETLADVSTVAFAVSGAGLASGLVLVFVPPTKPRDPSDITMLSLRGRF